MGTSPIEDIEAERERILREHGSFDAAVADLNHTVAALATDLAVKRAERRMTARYVEGCRCGFSDGRRL